MEDSYNLLVLKALEYFIDNPYEEVYLREFSRKLKISPNTAQRFLDLFLKQGLIKEEKKANLRYFKANLDNVVFRFIKKTYIIKKLQESGLIDHLTKNFSNVILFGSSSKGVDDRNSDIDLVCIGKGRVQGVDVFEERLDKEINVHVFSLAEWKKQKKDNRAFYQDVISDGINLIGEVPIVD